MNSNKTLIDFLKLMGKRLWIYLLAIFMMTAFSAGFDVVGSILIKQIFDIAQNGDRAAIYHILPVNIIVALVSVSISVTFMNIYNNEAKRASVYLKQKVFAKSLRLPMKYYDTHHSGEMISRLVFETDKASGVYTSRLRRVLAPIISVIVYVTACFTLNPIMTLALIMLNVLLIFINTALSKPMERVAKVMSKQNAVMTEKLSNLIAGMEICKIYDNEHKTEKQYIDANNAFIRAQKRKMCLSSLLESFNVGFDLLCALMFLIVGVYFLQNNMVTIGEVAAIYTMYGALSFRFLQLGKYYPELINCIAYAERIFEFLGEEEEKDKYKGVYNAIMTSAYDGGRAGDALYQEHLQLKEEDLYAVEVHNLKFAYDDMHKVFDDLSLSVPRNKNVVLTGKSGCGKSTLAKLLLGFYPYDAGVIKLLGKDMKELGCVNARKLIAYVPQEPYLFEASVMENIRYGRLEASDEEVVEAARYANAHKFILKQRDGYGTIVTDRGRSLSGGERQRIAIARAILKKAPVILFDEATSALDNESERLIQEVISKLKEERTVIMIAHRKSTIELADVEIGL